MIVLFVVCLFFSAFFSISETALTTLNKIRMRGLAENGDAAARRVMKLMERPEKMLSSILVGNNFVNLSASSLSTSFVIGIFSGMPGSSEWAVGLATGVVTLIVLIFGEITPKSFAVRYGDAIARFVAGPILFFQAIFTPIVFLLNKVAELFLFISGAYKREPEPVITEEEFRTMVDIGHEQGVLENEERHMISNVIEFGDGQVREVMTPRINVILADVAWSYQEVLDVVREHQFTRVPVYRDSPDEIVGILNVKDLLMYDVDEQNFSLEAILRKASFVYEFNNISEVFAQMRRDRMSIAVVLDEYGIPSGIVTIEDCIEEIVGAIEDEYDQEAEELIHKVGEEFLLDGSLSIDTFNEVVGSEIESDEFESIGGYLLGLASELPHEGVTIQDGGLAFEIVKTDANRIETIRVKYKDTPADEEE